MDYNDAYIEEKVEAVLAGKVKVEDLPPEVQMDVQKMVGKTKTLKVVKKDK